MSFGYFPPLHADSINALDASWAQVSKPEDSVTDLRDDTTITTKPSYADKAGHEKKQLETNPTPREQVQQKNLPDKSYGKNENNKS